MVAGNTNVVASKAYCDRQYWLIQHSQLYWTLQNTWTYPTAQAYVERLLREAPATLEQPLKGQLAVITNVSAHGSSYHVAEELALTVGMHLVLLSSNHKKLKTVEENLLKEAKRRGIAANQNYRKPTVFKVQYDAHSLKSVLEAAKDVRHIIDHKEEASSYKGISILIHNPSGVTVAYETTSDGVEINVGRNFVAPHVLTQQLLPLLKRAATVTPTFKPRIVYVSSVGHCQGTDFDPERFRTLPSEGGAPEGTLLNPGGQSGDYAAAATTAEETANKVYENEKELDGPVTMYYRAKMALIADAQALANAEPTLAPVSVYPGSVAAAHKKKSLGIAETIYQKGFYMFNLSPTQAARASLRAALDPAFNTGELPTGSYLHCDGNPWQPAQPTVDDPITGVPYQWRDYATKVRECTLQLTAALLETVYSPPVIDGNGTTTIPTATITEEKDGEEPTQKEPNIAVDLVVGLKDGKDTPTATITNEDATATAAEEKSGEGIGFPAAAEEEAEVLQMQTEQANAAS